MNAMITDPPVQAPAQQELAPDGQAAAGGSGKATPPSPPPKAPQRHNAPQRPKGAIFKRLATVAIVLIATLTAIVTWQTYVRGPWTRNGTVRVQVANVAPQVSGQIVELRVNDNQFVRAGDVLYVIDPFDFEVALELSKAEVVQAAADLEVKKEASERRLQQSSLTMAAEEQQTFVASAAAAKAVFEAAQHERAKAEEDLKRTKVLSPVTGYVTNLLLRVGDFAAAGNPNVTIIDAGSFWIDGYFEETKMADVCINDRVEARLMGYSAPIIGHVDTITRGISVSNAVAGAQGLPAVNPVYTWVTLAQRVPVRIAIDQVPEGVPLVSGMTATVTVIKPEEPTSDSPIDRAFALINESVSDLINGPAPSRPGCLPTVTTQSPPTESLPVPMEPVEQTPEQVLPGIAPGISASPTVVD